MQNFEKEIAKLVERKMSLSGVETVLFKEKFSKNPMGNLFVEKDLTQIEHNMNSSRYDYTVSNTRNLLR